MPKITPNLWFDTEAKEAAKFYTAIFPNSKITNISYYGEEGQEITGGKPGSVLTADFELDGQPFTGINGGPLFKFTEAVSFLIDCKDQDEVDYYWDKLLEGGEPSQCGWLKDKYGLAWQVVPRALGELLSDPDKEKSERVMAAMLKMVRLNVAELEKAHRGE